MITGQRESVKETLKRLKETVRSMDNVLLPAVDVGKTKHCVCFMNSQGEVYRRSFYFTNNREGFEEFMKQTSFYKDKHNSTQIIFGMEPSGWYWKPLYQYLMEKEHLPVTVSPLAVKRNRETLDVSKDKNDPKDAHNIGDLMMQGKFYLPLQRNKELSQLNRYMHIYYRLITDKAKLRNRLRSAVGYAFPELEQYFKNITAKTILVILEKYPLPSIIRTIPRHRFVSYVKKKNRYISVRRLKQIYKLAQNSVGITGEDQAVLFEIKMLLEELRSLEEKISQVNTQVDQIVNDREDYKLLLTIPGIGPITAASIIAEIGEINNFTSGKQLVKLAGLDLYGEQSGTSVHTLRHITKRGRKLLRTIMYQAAVSSIRKNFPLRKRYEEILSHQSSKKKAKPKAVVAIACKLLRIVYRMLTEKSRFSENYDNYLRIREKIKTKNTLVLN